uniref:Kinesin-like protein costa n=2 Tax=Drosophila pseudoobscura pseudoobscura TaxID=46245 RepID=COS_DROPS|nr:RecName: Full=Kinesin-like protein costa; AltName: Full=Kinesin-like protein costal2 [Drosophila pseudoobscura pseudoobscura]
MEIPIQVAVRICPYTEPSENRKPVAGAEADASAFGNAEAKAESFSDSEDNKNDASNRQRPEESTDANGNSEGGRQLKKETLPTDSNGNENGTIVPLGSGCCVQAIPISASALGLPSALPGGRAQDSIAAGLIQVGAHTVPVTHALGSGTTQSQLYYQTVFPLISLFLEGFDASVVTYGQRGQGKTYTLYGPGFECVYGEADQGVVQRCVRDIFAHIAGHSERTYAVNVGFVEICEGEVCDLLDMGNVHCQSVEEVFRWLQIGLATRQPKSAHSLFTLTLEQQWVSKEGLIQHRLSTASFSDLCATERWGEPPPGNPRDAGLQMLELVVNTLTDPSIMYGVNGNIPYGQTTLTTLLKDSFGGRAQTLVILCVSPQEQHVAETLGNLQFAFKVQCVRNYVIMNTYSDDNTPISPETMPNGSSNPGAGPLAQVAAGDNFGLQFAASQWFKLVSNAEGLFAKLMASNLISELEKEQIEEWLFLKQECEECLSSTEAMRSQKQLVPIQEAEEPEESVSEPPNSDNDTDNESQRPDLADKLESLMEEFRAKTDALIQSKHAEFLTKHPKAVMQSQERDKESKLDAPPEKDKEKIEERKTSIAGRRRSIQPGASLSTAELALLNRVALQQPTAQPPPSVLDPESSIDPLESSAGEGLRQAAIAAAAANAPIEQLQKKLRKLHAEIEGRQRQLKEIEQTMQVKQNIISELVKNSDTRSHAKQRFQKKKAKLEAECDKAKKHLAKALIQGREKGETERWSAIIAHIEHRLEDLSSMKHIAGESGQKLKKLQQSMAESRKQQEELEKKIRKESKLRDQLETELAKLKESRDGASGGKELVKLDSPEQQGRQLKAVQARITHLNHILREKSDNLEECAGGEGPAPAQQESLRHEIRNLRGTRDLLLDERCHLDRKLKRDKMLTQREERKLLECDEAIEAIDAAIEFKNELICGHKSIDTSDRLQREKGEQMLMARLNKLSPEEMRTLLYKYFNKVIDLRDSSRKLELQLVQLERERDAWEWKERVLSNAVRQARLEGERNAVLLQRQHEMKLTLMLRHLAEETSASSASYGERALAPGHQTSSGDFDYELDFYKAAATTTTTTNHKALVKPPKSTPSGAALEKYKDKEQRGAGRNIFAKFQVLTRYASSAASAAAAGSCSSTVDESTALIESTTTATATTTTTTTTTTTGGKGKERGLPNIRQDQLKRLMPAPTVTKVTRQKNKIIIQDASRRN